MAWAPSTSFELKKKKETKIGPSWSNYFHLPAALLESCSDIRELRALNNKQHLNHNSDFSRVCFCLLSIRVGSKPTSAVESKKNLGTSPREDWVFNAWSTHPLTLRHTHLFLVLQIIRQHLNQPSRGRLLYAAGPESSSWNHEVLWREEDRRDSALKYPKTYMKVCKGRWDLALGPTA